MLKIALFVFASVSLVVLADDTPQVDSAASFEAAAQQVFLESSLAQTFLDIALRFKRSMAFSSAGSSYFQLSLPKEQKQAQGSFGSFLQLDEDESENELDDEQLLEESDSEVKNQQADDDEDLSAARMFEEEESEAAADDDDNEADQYLEEDAKGTHASLYVKLKGSKKRAGNTGRAKTSMLAAFQLYSGIKHLFYQTLYQAHTVSQQYWADRTVQLQVQQLGDAVPAQTLQLIYLNAYATQVRTLKLSYQLQTISHFTMWLEDELDVHAAYADDVNIDADIVGIDQSDDLVRDKMFAFNAYSVYAMLDMQLVYLDLYLKSAMQAAGQNAATAAGASFLEEEMTEQNQFFAPGQGPSIGSYVQMMKLYQAFLQLNAAQSAQASVYAEKLALEKETDNDVSNDEEAAKQRRFAQQSFGGFGMNLMYSSQIESMLCMFELYSVYGAMYGQAPVQP